MGSKARASLIALALVALAASARAEPSAAEKETARGLMTEGRARRERNDLRGALESFRAADAIMHVPTTGLEVARSEIALGQLVEAADMLRAVLRLPSSPGDSPPFVAARDAASSLLDDVEKRLPSIRVIAPADASVAIDDLALPAAAIGEPFKVNPGHHVVRASKGEATARREVDVVERDAKSVSLDPSDTSVAAAAPSEAPPEETAPTPPRSHTMRTIAWTGVAVAGVGVAVGSITGLMSLSHTSSAKTFCNGDQCTPAAQSDLDSARSTATISTIAFVVAGAGAAAAVVGFVVGDGAAEPARAGRVVPLVGPLSVGARVAF